MKPTVRDRKFPRRTYTYPMGILHKGIYKCFAGHSIGEGGVGYLQDTAMKIKDRIVVSFYLENGVFCTVEGVVRQTSPIKDKFLCGVEFVNISFDFKRMIREYVAKRTEQEAINDFEQIAQTNS